MVKYQDAEIYITKCTHPQYSHLRYIGLDTKKDPDYLGSSIVLKWFINFIGRGYFKKEILQTVTGGMDACCNVEQEYILKYDAVKDSNFFNMNGGKRKVEDKDTQMDLELLVVPTAQIAHSLLSTIKSNVKRTIKHFDQSRGQMVNRVICLVVYGFLRYEQEEFPYNQHCHYGSCTSKDVQAVLNCLSRLGYIDVTYESITITPMLIEELPLMLESIHFSASRRES